MGVPRTIATVMATDRSADDAVIMRSLGVAAHGRVGFTSVTDILAS